MEKIKDEEGRYIHEGALNFDPEGEFYIAKFYLGFKDDPFILGSLSLDVMANVPGSKERWIQEMKYLAEALAVVVLREIGADMIAAEFKEKDEEVTKH